MVHEKEGTWILTLSAWPFQKQLAPSGSKINSKLELIKIKSKSGGCIYGYLLASWDVLFATNCE